VSIIDFDSTKAFISGILGWENDFLLGTLNELHDLIERAQRQGVLLDELLGFHALCSFHYRGLGLI
jgi:hypothetical protein